ncbi:MAG TPA: hypothetical protein DD723_00595 [Candidatus Omnitrophica bacterium]|nr:MAG: hypothetical protein A2Z81_09510 [Omnitrophica WOR_2 bacterium GWA2_45_18]OGX18343.1 MAG: hypothetical protein A2Y04_05265 [Omnitrophica WOR_2 bacterium GWC2_45_7]HBR14030.1 hypothetical protein [Candidatus Omnitrophota bacterium]
MKARNSIILYFVLMVSSIFLTPSHGRTCDSLKEEQSKNWNVKKIFIKKAHCILENQKGLGLSSEQIEKIKELKSKSEKEDIMNTAEVESLDVDVKAALMQDDTDVKAINKLIDKKFEFKKAKMKDWVESYAALKNILNDDQKKKMKDLFASGYCHLKKDGWCPLEKKGAPSDCPFSKKESDPAVTKTP